MRKLIFVFFCFSFSFSAICQIVVDKSKNPIPYVDVLVSRNKSIFWQTDYNGKIPEAAINSMQSKDTLILNHMTFESRSFIKSNLINLDTVELTTFHYELEEVSISAKLPKFQKIQACFRHSVFQDGNPIYYSDGTADYITKVKKLNYQLIRHFYRSYENKEIDKYLIDYNTAIPVNNAYTPILKEEYLPNFQARKHKLTFHTDDSTSISILTPDSFQIGKILIKENYIEYQLNNIYELKKRKLLNTEVETKDYFIYMVFRKKEFQEPLLTLKNYNELLYFKCNYGQTFKHDKDQEIKNVKSIQEIFVENISFTNFKNDDYSDQRGMPRESHFENEYWNDCDCDLYYQQVNKLFDLLEIL